VTRQFKQTINVGQPFLKQWHDRIAVGVVGVVQGFFQLFGTLLLIG